MKPEDRHIRNLTGKYRVLEIPRNCPVELDLGCGKGSFTCALAARYPERKIFAADTILGRLRKLYRHKQRKKLPNLELLRVEARYLVGILLPDAAIDRIHLLFPDPWPKTRHRYHRLLTSEFTSQLSRILKPEGSFHFATDDQQYFNSTDLIFQGSALFERNDSTCGDINDLKTDFQLLWESAGRNVQHGAWQKKLAKPIK